MFLDEKMEKTVQLARDLGMKKNLDQLGTNLIFDSRFRKLIQQASRKNGEEKIRILDTTIQAA